MKKENMLSEKRVRIKQNHLQKNVEQIFDLLNENSYSVTTDGMLMEIIMLGAQDYLNGNLSLDAATRQTLKKVGIYFAE